MSLQGETQAYGDYDSLANSGIDFTQLIPKESENEDSDEDAGTKGKSEVTDRVPLVNKQVSTYNAQYHICNFK